MLIYSNWKHLRKADILGKQCFKLAACGYDSYVGVLAHRIIVADSAPSGAEIKK
jgi:hypothetical protein